MIRFLISLCIVAVMAIPAIGQQCYIDQNGNTICPQAVLRNAPARTLFRSAVPQWQYQPQVRVQTFSPVQSRVVLSPVRSVFTPVVQSVWVNPSFAPAASSQATTQAVGDGNLKNRLALRLVLIRQARGGNADSRTILNSTEMFDELYGSLQAEHSAGVMSGTIQGKFTDFFEWVFEHQDQIAELIKLIISLFG